MAIASPNPVLPGVAKLFATVNVAVKVGGLIPEGSMTSIQYHEGDKKPWSIRILTSDTTPNVVMCFSEEEWSEFRMSLARISLMASDNAPESEED
ncbi:hypothetical protein UFOVP28_27 [uncultured Caudovirales phage]|uniref:Uncharacterized protein n=1 Tax=uncultured Caudovirales phage TaxID=2100421 RepID=A0A6J5KKC2_9CAUD|nr:hypothetical protein UFOVP28_27 [uncultured Caudovirales phage]